MRSPLLFLTYSLLFCYSTVAKQHVPDDFLVEGLDEIEPAFAKFEGKMYSGLLPMDNKNRHGKLQFWLFAPSNPTTSDTLTIWLNGGPGCSSFSGGVFIEIGPVTVPMNPAGYCCIEQNVPFVYNPNAWTQATHMLFVEQPIGVGFSYGEPPPQDEVDVARDFHAFLDNFYSVFTSYKPFDLYIFGESYAGMYIPSIALEVYEHAPSIRLKGVGIGNGLLDSKVQGPIRIDYAYYHGMIDSYTRQSLHTLWNMCIHKVSSMKDPFHSFDVPDDCGMLSAISDAAGANVIPDFSGGPNIYDVTTWDPYLVLKGNNSISQFYNNPAVKRKLHAPLETYWQACVPGAGRRRLESSYLIHDGPISIVPHIAKLLNGGIRVLLYGGDRDMACNVIGTDKLLNDMKWKGADQWFSTPRGLWTYEGKPAGYIKALQNLQFLVLYNSGHLAPYNIPEHALDLISRFLTNTTFYDYELPNFASYMDDNDANEVQSSVIVDKMLPFTIQDESMNHQSKSRHWNSVFPLLAAFVTGVGTALAFQNIRRTRGYNRIQ
jgi:carboxypeptidase C (cathepsin A)